MAVLLCGLLAVTAARGADKETVQACSKAYVAAQKDRKAGRLSAAKKKLLVCGQDSCPAVIKNDCVIWLSEVDAHLPTIVVSVRGKDGKDVTDVRVSIDGELVKASLDGRPITLDPGVHKLRIETVNDGPVERNIIVQQGVKNRAVNISFAAPGAPPPAATVDKGHPVAAYVFGALALGAAASWTTFGVLGFTEAAAYKEDCLAQPPTKDEPTCIDAKASAEAKLLGADISGGVTGGLLGIAVGLFIYHHVSEPSSTAQVTFQPTSGGARASLTVSF